MLRTVGPTLFRTKVTHVCELTKLVQNVDTAASKFGRELYVEKTKIMTNSDTLQRYTTIQGQKVETVDYFKYHNQ